VSAGGAAPAARPAVWPGRCERRCRRMRVQILVQTSSRGPGQRPAHTLATSQPLLSLTSLTRRLRRCVRRASEPPAPTAALAVSCARTGVAHTARRGVLTRPRALLPRTAGLAGKRRRATDPCPVGRAGARPGGPGASPREKCRHSAPSLLTSAAGAAASAMAARAVSETRAIFGC